MREQAHPAAPGVARRALQDLHHRDRLAIRALRGGVDADDEVRPAGDGDPEQARHDGTGPPGVVPFAISTVDRFCLALLYGRAGCFTVQNGGFRPGQSRMKIEAPGGGAAVSVGIGRIAASYHRASALY